MCGLWSEKNEVFKLSHMQKKFTPTVPCSSFFGGAVWDKSVSLKPAQVLPSILIHLFGQDLEHVMLSGTVDINDINRPQWTQRNHSCARETKETKTIKNGTITPISAKNRDEASFTLHFTCGFDRSSSVPNIQTHANKLFNLHMLHVLIYFTPAFALDSCHTMQFNAMKCNFITYNEV